MSPRPLRQVSSRLRLEEARPGSEREKALRQKERGEQPTTERDLEHREHTNKRPRWGRGAAAPAWFTCVHCAQPVSGESFGTTQRNHCPWCLWSKHLDEVPGDRAADCRGAMEPVAIWVRPGGDWAIIHRCRCCGALHSNRIAGDDNELALVSLAVRPIGQPAFPLERLAGESGAAK